MYIKSILTWFTLISTIFSSKSLAGKSFYTTRLDDPRAVYLTKDDFSVHADGIGNDTEVLQAAIDKASENRAGVVFIPEGTYLLSKTVYVWPGVRLIGYGAERPAFNLGENTPAGGTVLLSPGFASFGMFENEFHRGDEFKRIVGEIEDGE